MGPLGVREVWQVERGCGYGGGRAWARSAFSFVKHKSFGRKEFVGIRMHIGQRRQQAVGGERESRREGWEGGRHNRIKIKQFNVAANKASAADENEDADRDAWLVASSTSLTPCRARKERERVVGGGGEGVVPVLPRQDGGQEQQQQQQRQQHKQRRPTAFAQNAKICQLFKSPGKNLSRSLSPQAA